MFSMPSLLTVAKYEFICMVFTSAGFLIGNVIGMEHRTVEPLDDLVYKPRTSRQLEETALGLKRDYSKCFTEPTKTFVLGNVKELFWMPDVADQREREDDIQVSPFGVRRHPVHTLLVEFSEYMNSLGIQAVILEPSMLFCAVSFSNKYKLLIKGFNPHDFLGSHKTVTVGIFEDDAKILEAAIWGPSQNKTSRSSFKAYRSRNTQLDEPYLYSVHFLFVRGSLEVHVVVLFERNNYLWHSEAYLTPREFLFVNEGTYESFTSIPLVVKNDPELKLHIPSSPTQFMFQIPNSEVLYCQSTAEEVKIFPHPTLTEEQLLNRAVIAIQELKASFQPHFVNFWLWTESLSGWFSDCNVFQETFELNIAVFQTSVKRLNLTEIFANSNYLKFSESHHLDEKDVRITLNCYGLRINIFVCHEERDIVWYQYKTAEDVDSKRVIPFKFGLCSSDMLGQRVNVPCETRLIIEEQSMLAKLTVTDALHLY